MWGRTWKERTGAACAALMLGLTGCALDRSGLTEPNGPARDGGAPDAPAIDAGPCGGPELCNGLDDDCNPATPDGSGELDLGAACDGDDADRCAGGIWSCVSGALVCDDDGVGGTETCDGQDDDCDGKIDEGGVEVCNRVDDDCDGVVDEAGASDAQVFAIDDDGDGHGDAARTVRACERPQGTASAADDCDDGNPGVYPGHLEACNALDDDCSGEIDEEGCTGCTPHYRDGRVYQVCSAGLSFEGALRFCSDRAYHLVAVDDSAENEWIFARAYSAVGRYWIGARESGGEWVRTLDGAKQIFLPWNTGEPNDGGPFDREDCINVGAHRAPTFNDENCDASMAWVCEL